MQGRKPNAAPYVLAAIAIAATVWTVLGSPHREMPVAQQFARDSARP
jgi:hypothetical protein